MPSFPGYGCELAMDLMLCTPHTSLCCWFTADLLLTTDIASLRLVTVLLFADITAKLTLLAACDTGSASDSSSIMLSTPVILGCSTSISEPGYTGKNKLIRR